jgi:hypothetical protein
MNASRTAPVRPPREPQGGERGNPARTRERGEDFDRLLREKAARHQDEETAAEADPPAAQAFAGWLMAPPPRREGREGDEASAPGAGDGAAKAAKGAAAAADADPPQSLATPANAAGAWELTLRQPLSAALDLHATRTADAGHGWSLTVASPTVDASVLARHAPRLNERLKARALSNTHVRIEERDEEDKS